MELPVTSESMNFLLDSFANTIHQGLLHCSIAPQLPVLRKNTQHARWMIVSGGDQAELRTLFNQRDLAQMFDGGIFGSPDNKVQIFARESACGNLAHPALFFGDSLYDHQAAVQAGLDFVFVSAWTEFADWEHYCKINNITVIEHLPD